MKRVVVIADHELDKEDRFQIAHAVRGFNVEDYELDMYWKEHGVDGYMRETYRYGVVTYDLVGVAEITVIHEWMV